MHRSHFSGARIRPIALSSLALIAIAACATYSRMFVNAQGQLMQCSATGGGLVGMAMASQAENSCAANMMAAGYLDLDSAGVIGISIEQPTPSDPIRIIMVVEGGPAAVAGLLPGDTLEAVNGHKVETASHAGLLLFGGVGREISLTVARNGSLTRSPLSRPYPEVYGRRGGDPPHSPMIERRGLMIEPSSATLSLGQRLQLTATAYDSTGVMIAGQRFTWRSSNAEIATVTPDGLVTARAYGIASITATAGALTGKAEIAVE